MFFMQEVNKKLSNVEANKISTEATEMPPGAKAALPPASNRHRVARRWEVQ